MAQLLEWSPLLAFFIVFKLTDIYWATGTLMVACVALMLVHRALSGRFKPMHVFTAVLVMVLGTATLLLHDKRFIQLKPTLLLGVTAVVFLGSGVIGRQPLARRMLEGVFTEPVDVAPREWLLINALWAGFFAVLAALNLYIAHHFAENIWVNFKVFGITAAMMVFMVPQVLWLNGRTRPKAPADGSGA